MNQQYTRAFLASISLSLMIATVACAAPTATVTFGTSSIDQLVLAGMQTEGMVQYQAMTGLGWEIVNTGDSRGNPPSALATFYNGSINDQTVGDRVEFQLVGGGLFRFLSVDTRSNGPTPPTNADSVSISGTLAGVPVGSLTPTQTASYATTSGFSGLIDKLTVTLTQRGDTAFWIDNLTLDLVPEPGTCAMAAIALFALNLPRNRRRDVRRVAVEM
jgi:hypothetical protein